MRQRVPGSGEADQLLLVLRCVQLERGRDTLACTGLARLLDNAVESVNKARKACSQRGTPLDGHSECRTALLLLA